MELKCFSTIFTETDIRCAISTLENPRLRLGRATKQGEPFAVGTSDHGTALRDKRFIEAAAQRADVPVAAGAVVPAQPWQFEGNNRESVRRSGKNATA